MNRNDLEEHVAKEIQAGKVYVYLIMNGDPNSSRQRLLGHRKGPYGWVCGCVSPDNIVRFNAQYLQDYLDDLPIDVLGGSEDVAAEIATSDLLGSHCNYKLEDE